MQIPLVSKFRPGLSARLKDISEKQVTAKPKPIEGVRDNGIGAL